MQMKTHRQNDQLLIRSYLLGRRLREYHETLAEGDSELMELLEEHMQNVSCYFFLPFYRSKRSDNRRINVSPREPVGRTLQPLEYT